MLQLKSPIPINTTNFRFNKITKLSFLILLFVLFSSLGLSYSGNIYGKVLDKNGNILYNQLVEIYFYDFNDTFYNYTTTTYSRAYAQQVGNYNLEGFFFFDNELISSGEIFLLRVKNNPSEFGIILSPSSKQKPPLILLKGTESDKSFMALNHNQIPDNLVESYKILKSLSDIDNKTDFFQFVLKSNLYPAHTQQETIEITDTKPKKFVNFILLFGLFLLGLVFLLFIFFNMPTNSNFHSKSIVSDKLVINSVMHRKLIKIEHTATLTQAVDMMLTHNVGYLVILKHSNIIGIITEKDILNKLLDSDNFSKELVSDCMTKKIISVTPDTSVFEASQIMKTHKIHRILVQSGPAYTGILSIYDLISLWSTEFESEIIENIKPFKALYSKSKPIPELKVQKWLETKLIETDSNITLGEAIKLLLYSKNGCLIINDDNKTESLLTFKDIISNVISNSLPLDSSLKPLLNSKIVPISLDIKSDLISAISQMHTSSQNYVLVKDNNQIKGIISPGEILNAYIHIGKLYHKYN